MTDRDRLIELIKQKQNGGWRFITGEYTTDVSNECLADHLLANGVIVPPCKVGDIVYALYNGKVLKASIFSMQIETGDNNYIYMLKLKIFDNFFQFKTFWLGRNVFLTKEEAEEKLNELNKGE